MSTSVLERPSTEFSSIQATLGGNASLLTNMSTSVLARPSTEFSSISSPYRQHDPERLMPWMTSESTVNSLAHLRQQMDESHVQMVDYLTAQMGAVITPAMLATNELCSKIAKYMKRLNQVMGVDDNDPNDLVVQQVRQGRRDFSYSMLIPNLTQGQAPNNDENLTLNLPETETVNNIQEHPEVEIPPQSVQNPYPLAVMQRGEDFQAALARQNLARFLLRQDNRGAQFEPDDVHRAVEQALNRIGFNVGYTYQPNFASAFPEWVQHVEMPRGVKVPKLSKFSGEDGESTVEHVARYTIEMGDMAVDEALKMRFFPSSLTKNAFSWFSTLQPNSIHSWAQLERAFHDQFFRGELRVALTDLLSVKRYNRESIDDYLTRFKQMRSRCFIPIPEAEVVKMAVAGLDYHIRKRLVTQHLVDLSQLAEKVRQIEQLHTSSIMLEKDQFNKEHMETSLVNHYGVNLVDMAVKQRPYTNSDN